MPDGESVSNTDWTTDPRWTYFIVQVGMLNKVSRDLIARDRGPIWDIFPDFGDCDS